MDFKRIIQYIKELIKDNLKSFYEIRTSQKHVIFDEKEVGENHMYIF